MLDYVWKYCIKPQLGYSFSRNHTLPYSAIALQEMNLYQHFPSVYWQCAVLSVNASAMDENDTGSTDYGKIASAINTMIAQGGKVDLPDIARAHTGFRPDVKRNTIVFGLKGLVGVGDEAVASIIANRPYADMRDFMAKNPVVGKGACISLIKGGAFDELMISTLGICKTRFDVMRHYLGLLSEQEVEAKATLDFKNIKAITRLPDFLPAFAEFPLRAYEFRAHVRGAQFTMKNSAKRKVHRVVGLARSFFESELNRFMREEADYYYEGETLFILSAALDKVIDKLIAPVKEWMALPETIKAFNAKQREAYVQEVWEKNCGGTQATWEMDALCFYHGPHELAVANLAQYAISDFNTIPAEPVPKGEIQTRVNKTTGKEMSFQKWELFRIAGTVLDKNTNKHTISLLTPTGVVSVKFYSGQYANYNKTISTIDTTTGAKTVVDQSWFKRGTLLCLTGIRRDTSFFPKTYRDSVYNHSVVKITSVGAGLQFQLERNYE